MTDQKISFTLLFPKKTFHETFFMDASTNLAIYFLNMRVNIQKRGPFWSVAGTLISDAKISILTNKPLKSFSKNFKSRIEAEKERNSIEPKNNHEHELMVKNGGIFAPVSWIKSLSFVQCNKFIRIAQHPKRQDEFFKTNSKLVLDPYYLGIWCGDGSSRNTHFTNTDLVIIDWMKNYVKTEFDLDYTLNSQKEGTITYRIARNGRPYISSLEMLERRKAYIHSLDNPHLPYTPRNPRDKSRWEKEIKEHGREKFLLANIPLLTLKKLNLINNKHIPEIYLHALRYIRMKLLGGLIDSDGHRHSDCYEICQKNINLADDIIKLGNSLGFFVNSRMQTTIATNTVAKLPCESKRLYISGLLLNEVPVLVPRKKIVSHGRFFPTILFDEKKVNLKRKRIIIWRKQEEELVMRAFEVHGKKWAKIRDQEPFHTTAKKMNLTTDDIRNKINKLIAKRENLSPAI